MSAQGSTGEEVRQEARLVVRVAAGAGLGGLVAVPFVLLLALVVTEAEWLERIDQGVADRVNLWALARPGVVRLLEVVEVLTSPWMFRLAVLVVAVVLWRGGARRLATWAVVTMAVGGLLNVAVKEVVARARPTFDDPVSFAGAYSFPSGHAQNSLMGVAVLLLVVLPVLGRGARRAALAAGAAVVLLTGFDRVGLGVHFLSDVVAGWIIGGAVVVGTVVAFGAPHRRRSSRSASR